MIAIYIDINILKYEEKIKYAFDFVFRTLGYEYKYIKTSSDILSNDILIYYGTIHPTLQEAYELVFRKIFFYIPFESEMYDFEDLSPAKLRNNIVELSDSVPAFCTVAVTDEIIEEYRGLYYCSFGFDVIGNSFFHLNNGAQKVFGTEMLYDNNFENYYEKPFINYYLQTLEIQLENAFGKQQRYFLIKKAMWPEGENLAASVSHTINSLKKWDMKRIIKSDLYNLFHFYKVQYILQTIISKTKYLLTNFEEYWTFDKINEIENEKAIESTFFVGADSSEKKCFDYSIEDEDLKIELDKIMQRNCEIALLAPEYSLHEDVYGTNKKIISEITGTTKIGVRQQNHSYDQRITAELHEKNSFHYDSSQYYSKTAGFKNGISTPFRIFRINNSKNLDEITTNSISTHLEIPVAFSFDSLRLSKFKNLSFLEAKRIIDKLIENARKIDGLFSYDIALAAFADIGFSSDLYYYILGKLAEQKTYYGTFSEIANWSKNRDAVYIQEKNRRITVYFPYYFKHFTVSIVGDFKVAVIDYENVIVVGDRITFKEVPADTHATIILEASENKSEDE